MNTETADLTMYTTSWCSYCHRLKAQLGRAGVGVREIDIERDSRAAARVEGLNGGNRTVPTVVYADGSSATNPSVREVLSALAGTTAPAAGPRTTP